MTFQARDANNNQTVAAPPRASAADCTLDGTHGHSVKTAYDERDMVLQVVTKSDGKVSKSTYAYFDDGQLKGIQEPRSFDPADGSSSGTDQSVGYTRYPNKPGKRLCVDELDHVTDGYDLFGNQITETELGKTPKSWARPPRPPNTTPPPIPRR